MTTRRSLAAIAAVLSILAAGVALLYIVGEQVSPTTVSSASSPTPTATATTAASTSATVPQTAPTVSQPAPPTQAVGTPTPASLLAGVCGSVIGGPISDGAHMFLTLSSGGSANATYSLEYQFESGGGAHPLDIDGRLAGTMAWLSGRQVPAGSGAPAGAVGLREWTLRRAMSCAPLSIVDPTPSLFMLPQGCAFIGSPVSTADHTDWKVDCGVAADRNARGTLGPALAAEGWASCGSGLASASWANSRFLLIVSESSGAAGEYPKLTQRLRTTSACP